MNPFSRLADVILRFWSWLVGLFTGPPGPRIDGFDPGDGWPGTIIEIRGSDFAADRDSNLVKIGGATALVIEAAPQRLLVLAGVSTVTGPVTIAVAGQTGTSAELVVKAEPVGTTTDRAVSIGMMVTELVLNALKYAYPEGRPGQVRILCRGLEGDVLELTVEDDGVGLAPGMPAKGGGLGERIIGMMAQKLHATVERDSEHKGVRTVIRIPPAPETPAA